MEVSFHLKEAIRASIIILFLPKVMKYDFSKSKYILDEGRGGFYNPKYCTIILLFLDRIIIFSSFFAAKIKYYMEAIKQYISVEQL